MGGGPAVRAVESAVRQVARLGPSARRAGRRAWTFVVAAGVVVGLVAGVQQLVQSAQGPPDPPGAAVRHAIDVPRGSLDDPVAVRGLRVATVVAARGVDRSYTDRVEVAAGGAVTLLVLVANDGDADLDDVTVRVSLPDGVSGPPGAVAVFNGNYPDGYVYDEGPAALGTTGVGIGSYRPGSNAYLRVRVDIPDHGCGRRAYAFVATVTAGGVSADDAATVDAVAEC